MAERPEGRRRRLGIPVLVGIALVMGVAFGVRTLVQGLTKEPAIFRNDLATEFFERYVDADGRVVRRDQGSDSVSEGQAYAMLLAVALDDADRFDSVWRWTQRELQRSDALLSWRWMDGRRADPQPATDADIDAAYALLLAGERFGNPGYLREARRIAAAILDTETVRVADGRFVLAGPWARNERIVNPSYLAPESFRRFAEASGDDRWKSVLVSSVELAENVTARGTSLPPDWARVEDDGSVHATDAPGASTGSSSSGLDAPRLIVRFAASCDADVRELAARLKAPAARGLANDMHPLKFVAAAAGAFAAGEMDEGERLLERGERIAREHPTYYGWAWVALGRAMLDPKALRSCPGLGDIAEFAPGWRGALVGGDPNPF